VSSANTWSATAAPNLAAPPLSDPFPAAGSPAAGGSDYATVRPVNFRLCQPVSQPGAADVESVCLPVRLSWLLFAVGSATFRSESRANWWPKFISVCVSVV